MSEARPMRDPQNNMVDALKQITAINQRYGIRAEGGGTMPSPPPGTPTVLPPETPPFTGEIDPDAENLFPRPPGSHNVEEAPPPEPPRAYPPEPQRRYQPVGRGPAGFSRLTTLDLVGEVVVADNGERFPIPPPVVTELKSLAWRLMVQATNDRMIKMGLEMGALQKTEDNKEGKNGAEPGREKVSKVRRRSAKKGVSTKPPKGRRAAGMVPSVPERDDKQPRGNSGASQA